MRRLRRKLLEDIPNLKISVGHFYSDKHGSSQRVATLLRYIAPACQDRLALTAVKVADRGKPDRNAAAQLQAN